MEAKGNTMNCPICSLPLKKLSWLRADVALVDDREGEVHAYYDELQEELTTYTCSAGHTLVMLENDSSLAMVDYEDVSDLEPTEISSYAGGRDFHGPQG